VAEAFAEPFERAAVGSADGTSSRRQRQSSRLNSQRQPWFAEAAKKAIAWRATNRLRPTSEEKKFGNAVACAYLWSDVGTTAVEKVLFTQVLECGLDARVKKMGSPKWIAPVGRTLEKLRPLRPARAAHH
jgi:hypothetical protein